jgi:hypothetical protein
MKVGWSINRLRLLGGALGTQGKCQTGRSGSTQEMQAGKQCRTNVNATCPWLALVEPSIRHTNGRSVEFIICHGKILQPIGLEYETSHSMHR